MHGKPTGERDSQVITQRAEFPPLVGEVINKFTVFAIFSGENLFEFKNRTRSGFMLTNVEDLEGVGTVRIYCDGAMTFKDGCDCGEYSVADDHVFPIP